MPISATPRPPGSSSSQAPVMNARAALAVATTIFFMWGFLTSLNDVLIPHLKAVFELNYTRAMLVQFTFFGAYFLMSVPAGRLVARLGYKKGIIAGLLIAGVGALGFWPSAALRTYEAFLASLFVLASGITVLQVAANPYVALLGPEQTASSRLTLAQALNSLGTTLAPLFGGFLILSTAVKSGDEIDAMPVAEQMAYRAAEAQSVQGPYVGLAIALVLLAVFVYLFRLPSLTESTEQADSGHHTLLDALKHPHVLFGVLAIFFYVGAEVSIGSLMELPGAAGDWRHDRTAGHELRVGLLGLRHGRPFRRRVAAGQILAAPPAGRFRRCQRGAAGRHPDVGRQSRAVRHRGDRSVQLHHVPDHLLAGHRTPGTVDQQGLQPLDHGHRRRRDHPAATGHAGRPHRPAPELRAAGDLLRLHHFLRSCGLAPAGCPHAGRLSPEWVPSFASAKF